MEKFTLTFRREDIEELYQITEEQQKLKSVRFYVPLLMVGFCILAGLYWCSKYEDSSQNVFIGVMAFAYAYYLGVEFRKKYKTSKGTIAYVAAMVQQCEKYAMHQVSLSDKCIVLEQDQDYYQYDLADIKALDAMPDHIFLTFTGDRTLLLPRKSFGEGEFDKIKKMLKPEGVSDVKNNKPI